VAGLAERLQEEFMWASKKQSWDSAPLRREAVNGIPLAHSFSDLNLVAASCFE
jgi:hypothetical protein